MILYYILSEHICLKFPNVCCTLTFALLTKWHINTPSLPTTFQQAISVIKYVLSSLLHNYVYYQRFIIMLFMYNVNMYNKSWFLLTSQCNSESPSVANQAPQMRLFCPQLIALGVVSLHPRSRLGKNCWVREPSTLQQLMRPARADTR